MSIRAMAGGFALVLAALAGCGGTTPAPTVATEPAAVAPAPASAETPAPPATSRVLKYTEQRLLATDAALNPPAYPIRTNPGGATWYTEAADDWTAGFYPGTLWRTYERTRDPDWLQRAKTWSAGLARQSRQDSTDLGFKLFDTYGVGYQLTGDESYKRVVLAAADTVARRYDPEVGMFRVWDGAGDRTRFRVNIDSLMNMELMFWAGQNGGNPKYADMAKHHALRALQDLVRPDAGTWMVANYNQTSGTLLNHSTTQGYSTESTWARGQAWSVYGFTTAYRYTKDPKFLDAARRTADYFVRRLPPDKVPYWDFDVPNKATAPRDSSAAAIVASALIELGGDETDPVAKQGRMDTARAILTSLSSPTYAPRQPKFAAMLQHGTQHFPKGVKDTGLTFGDYYFVEALGRYEKAGGSTAEFMSG